MKKHLIASVAIAAVLAGTSNASAQETLNPMLAQASVSQVDFARFTPRPEKQAALDYSIWEDALQYMVLRMGPSTRDGERRPDPGLGTRQVYGHDSRVRLEGNRIPFSIMDAAAIEALTEYRRDLETIGSDIDVATLPRNEQLAYWINLHNVAVIEQIALNYPLISPSRMKLGANQTPLDETPFITVGGVSMSPKDIRTRIVFPNWKDPKVIYGFFRGEVGGPSVLREAHTGENVERLLLEGGGEFVNSLRGVEGYGKSLLVSEIYKEAAPFYFPELGDDFRAHLNSLAQDEVKGLIASKSEVKFNQYVDRVADLAGGEREPTYNEVVSNDRVQGFRMSPSVARLLTERQKKYEKLRKEGRTGRVLVLPNPGETIGEPEAEVD